MIQGQDGLTREQVLLRAMVQLFKKQNESGYVLNLLEETTVWDGADCDGGCLLEEAGQLLVDSGIDVEYTG